MSDDWPRPLVHWELQARDPARLRAFYAALFNWRIEDGPVMRVAPGIGGPEPGPGGHIRGGDAPGWSPFVQVRDIRASCDRAAELGGTVVTPPFDLPDTPTLAEITDPEGNRLMLVQQ